MRSIHLVCRQFLPHQIGLEKSEDVQLLKLLTELQQVPAVRKEEEEVEVDREGMLNKDRMDIRVAWVA